MHGFSSANETTDLKRKHRPGEGYIWYNNELVTRSLEYLPGLQESKRGMGR